VVGPPTYDLSSLNEFIAQQENYLRGQLKSIRSDGKNTIIDIDDAAGQRPATNTLVTVESPPPGARVVTSAEIFLGAQPVLAIAYRPE
jgi:hypothetical protein